MVAGGAANSTVVGAMLGSAGRRRKTETPWASRLGLWQWIVDSGAELNVAGAFIYQYSMVLARDPDVRIRGVDGAETQVDAVVRTVLTLPDGEHVMREILVCDPFDIALWGAPYMSEFGFGHWLTASSKLSYVSTPSGARIPLLTGPYRIVAPLRKPTVTEALAVSTMVSGGEAAVATAGVGALHAPTRAVRTAVRCSGACAVSGAGRRRIARLTARLLIGHASGSRAGALTGPT